MSPDTLYTILNIQIRKKIRLEKYFLFVKFDLERNHFFIKAILDR